MSRISCPVPSCSFQRNPVLPRSKSCGKQQVLSCHVHIFSIHDPVSSCPVDPAKSLAPNLPLPRAFIRMRYFATVNTRGGMVQLSVGNARYETAPLSSVTVSSEWDVSGVLRLLEQLVRHSLFAHEGTETPVSNEKDSNR